MDALCLLKTRIKNPLEWSSAGKCWLLLLMTAILHTEYLLWGLSLTRDPSPLVNVDYALSQLPWLQAICLVSWLLVALLPLLHRLLGDSTLYEYFALTFYGLTLCYAGHFTGTLSIAAGAVLAGAPVFGFIFFRTAPVLVALGVSLLVQGILSWGAVEGHWPYAPLIVSLTDHDGQLAPVWALSMYAFALPHVFMLAAVSYYILQRWRAREAEVRYLSLTDALTGLPNRRNVMAELNRQVEIARRYGLPLTVMMIDVDHFKRINDGYGHPAGDAVLSAVAHRLHNALRQSDVVGRFGGEEFMAVLTGTAPDGACILAERCRQMLADTPVQLNNGTTIQVTASFGIGGTAAGDTATAEELLKRADHALYAAKQGGRNRVESAAFDGFGDVVTA